MQLQELSLSQWTVGNLGAANHKNKYPLNYTNKERADHLNKNILTQGNTKGINRAY